MLLAGLDFETTGLDPKKDLVVEIGVVMWSTEHRCVLSNFSYLVELPADREISAEITAISGINTAMARAGTARDQAFRFLVSALNAADFWVAHNAGFEESFLKEELARHPSAGELKPKPWIDTAEDVPYPKHIHARSLIHLGAEHGLLNRVQHRALPDATIMMEILSRYDLAAIMEEMKEPRLEISANVPFMERDKAKERGYRWNPERKLWLKVIKERDFPKEELEAKFPVLVHERLAAKASALTPGVSQ